jgi:mono/diheme cytochrome c family protein
MKIKRVEVFLAVLPLAVVLLAERSSAQSQLGSQAASSGVLVKQYCTGCHSDRLKTAGVSLERRSLDSVRNDPELWEKVIRKVRAGEMPPAGMPRSSAAAQKDFTAYLESELDRAAALHPNPGRPTAHRLNRNEYSNAIRDLLALDVNIGDTLPVDDSGYGFDNIADVLSLSPVLVERYMAAARKVVRLALGNTDLKPVVDTFDGLSEVRASRGTRQGRNERLSEDLPFDSAAGLSFRYTFPVDAEYVFSVKLSGGGGAFGETAPPVGDILDLRVPVKAGVRQVGLTFLRSDAIQETAGGRGGAGGRGAGPKYLDLRLDGKRLKLYEISLQVPEGKEINQLAIGGPYNISGPGDTASRRKVLVCRPESSKDEETCAVRILSSLTRQAYRRTSTPADLQQLMPLFRSGRKERGFEAGIEEALQGMLVSPNFLFRIEPDPPGAAPGGTHRLNDFELASRLSFFLWSSIPDDELLDLAEKGRLKDTDVIRRQVTRMLENPKSQAFVQNFTGQWLLLRNLDQLKPDPLAFPGYDYSLRRAFREETQLFFSAILRENRPVTDLLDARFTFVNQRLAEFYGIPGVYGSRFRRVEIADPRRGGLLGQGSILTVTSYPNRTSVVQRGKWVLDSLLGSPPPPPPPNVPALDLHEKEKKLSVRGAMEAHRADPVCASCHARMDPIGFALENYNGIGQWRNDDADGPINSVGKLPDGVEVNGPEGLKQLLLTRYREQFITTFTEKLMTYALGRGSDAYDMPAIRAMMRQAAKDNLTLRALIDCLVESPQFLTKRNADL